jgi:hypothetical protein
MMKIDSWGVEKGLLVLSLGILATGHLLILMVNYGRLRPIVNNFTGALVTNICQPAYFNYYIIIFSQKIYCPFIN